MFLEAEHKIQVPDGFFLGFLRHRDHALREPQIQVILQGQMGADRARKERDDAFHQRGTLKADVNPLGQVAGEAGGIFLLRVKRGKQVAMFCQARHPMADAPAYQILLELR